jgi:hypothetical protein
MVNRPSGATCAAVVPTVTWPDEPIAVVFTRAAVRLSGGLVPSKRTLPDTLSPSCICNERPVIDCPSTLISDVAQSTEIGPGVVMVPGCAMPRRAATV